MSIKINYSVTAFFIGSVLLAIGFILVMLSGINSVSLADMFAQNPLVTTFGTVLVVGGFGLNAFASKK